MAPRSGISRCLVLLTVASATLASLPAACRNAATETEEPVMTFSLTSSAFSPNERIPPKYTGEGADVSPPLAWGEPPAAAQTLALICDDPDAPRGTWDHWLIWNIPGSLRALPEGISKKDSPPEVAGAVQGSNSWPKVGYYGPMPPPGHGTHHYHFTLYALNKTLDLKPGANKKALLAAMKGHVLAEGKLTGIYSR
jgi:hypothetical protein